MGMLLLLEGGQWQHAGGRNKLDPKDGTDESQVVGQRAALGPELPTFWLATIRAEYRIAACHISGSADVL
jgi:hypothetical protein